MVNFRSTRVLVAGAVLIGTLLGSGLGMVKSRVSQTQPSNNSFCRYDPQNDTLFALNSSDTKKQDGIVFPTVFRNIFTNYPKPLAVVCNQDSFLWWIDQTSLYKANILNGQVQVLQQIGHATSFLYYQQPDTRIVAADILIPQGSLIPSVATVTNNGLIRIFMPSNSNSSVEHSLFLKFRDVEPGLDESVQWPSSVSSAVLRILNRTTFAVVPIGPTKVFYTVSYSGPIPYRSSVSQDNKDCEVRHIDLSFYCPGLSLKEIVAAEDPNYSGLRSAWFSMIHVDSQAGTRPIELDLTNGAVNCTPSP